MLSFLTEQFGEMTHVKSDPLDVLLFVIGVRFAQLAHSDNTKFTSLLKNRNFTIQLGSEEEGIARYFVINNGTFSQHGGEATDPSLTITFKNSMTGVKLLTKADAAAFMSGIQQGDVKMTGDYSLLMWFNQVAKHIVPQIPEALEPVVEKVKPLVEKATPVAMNVCGKVMAVFNPETEKSNQQTKRPSTSKYFKDVGDNDKPTKQATYGVDVDHPKTETSVQGDSRIDESKVHITSASDQKDSVREQAESVIDNLKAKVSGVTETLHDKLDELGGEAKEKFAEVKDNLQQRLGDVKDKAQDVKEQAEDKAAELKDKAEDKIDEIKDTAADLKDQAEDKAAELKDKAEDKIDEAKDTAADLKDQAEDKAQDFKHKAGYTLNQGKEQAEDLKDSAEDKVEQLKEQAAEALNASKEKAEELKTRGEDKVADLKDHAEEKLEDTKQKASELQNRVENKAQNLKTEAENKIDDAKSSINDLKTNDGQVIEQAKTGLGLGMPSNKPTVTTVEDPTNGSASFHSVRTIEDIQAERKDYAAPATNAATKTKAAQTTHELEKKHLDDEVIAENVLTAAVQNNESPITGISVTKTSSKDSQNGDN